MTEMKSIDPKNLRNVTVPLEIAQIKEYFENKELFFLINYSESKIKGNMFLTYITNLDLPCEIVLTGSSKDDRFELLKTYMETRNLSQSQTLKFAAAQILLEKKGFNADEIFINTVMNREECKEFTEKNSELVSRWNTFISSTMLFTISTSYLEETYNFKNDYKVIDDPHYIGSNIVQIFSVPAFLEMFFSVPADSEVYYFKPQFEEFMFRGKKLIDYFFCEENTLLWMFKEIINREMKPEDVEQMLDKAMI